MFATVHGILTGVCYDPLPVAVSVVREPVLVSYYEFSIMFYLRKMPICMPVPRYLSVPIVVVVVVVVVFVFETFPCFDYIYCSFL